MAGFLILVGFTLIVYMGGAVVSLRRSPVSAAVLVLWLVGLAVETVREWRTAYADRDTPRFDPRADALDMAAVVLGALATFWLSVELDLGPVVASSLLGVGAAACLKPWAVPLFCGSFVGMASLHIYDYPCIAVAGAIAGVVYVAARHVFGGFGGKLGTAAWAGCVFASLSLGRPLIAGGVPGWDVGLPLIAYCAAGAWGTSLLSHRCGQGPVMASGLVGLAGGLVLPALHGADLGGTLAVGVFCASFAGMSGTNRFERSVWMAPAGVLCALAFMFSARYLGGGGGKLGTIAFGAVIGLRGLIRIAGTLKRHLRRGGQGLGVRGQGSGVRGQAIAPSGTTTAIKNTLLFLTEAPEITEWTQPRWG